jgi:hypothetical protein
LEQSSNPIELRKEIQKELVQEFSKKETGYRNDIHRLTNELEESWKLQKPGAMIQGTLRKVYSRSLTSLAKRRWNLKQSSRLSSSRSRASLPTEQRWKG